MLKSLKIFALFLILASFAVSAQSNQAPRADFRTSPANPDTNTPVLFDASSSRDPDGQIVRYEWDFNGDGKFDETKTTPTASTLFERAGDWRINLRVTDNRGATASISKVIKINEAPVVLRRQIALPAGGRVTAGQILRATLHIRINKPINGLGLDEDPPANWAVRERDNAGAVFKRSQMQWLWSRRFESGQTITVVYELTVPPGTRPGVFKFSGQLTSFSPRLAISVVGDTELRTF
ncbi:PKD domain-containing protein [Candidatus Acetothermia bacterium]|jgi:PKD repeat protein|nr:PKD domain-containing protein [Candidatus Acetothermia bacterium]MCI2432587.1 PKD domain-containing protein [Candidatus Acetothermia bacterium]MCI2436405.1 PKD domain-containing protein [Candidatus Acetothermia bacterium]